ncbi:hypothetical protein IWX92DRAFT_17707 [Phyllosticta citricarpa]
MVVVVVWWSALERLWRAVGPRLPPLRAPRPTSRPPHHQALLNLPLLAVCPPRSSKTSPRPTSRDPDSAVVAPKKKRGKKKKKKKNCHACASGSLLCQSIHSKLCTTWPRIHGFAMTMPLLHATFLSMSDITRRTFRFQVASTRKTCRLLCKTNIPTSVAGTTQRPSPHGVRLLSSFNIRPLPVVLTAVFTIKLIQASMCWCGAAPLALQTWLISLFQNDFSQLSPTPLLLPSRVLFRTRPELNGRSLVPTRWASWQLILHLFHWPSLCRDLSQPVTEPV